MEPSDADALAGTFAWLQALHRAGLDGIWAFVFRDLAAATASPRAPKPWPPRWN